MRRRAAVALVAITLVLVGVLAWRAVSALPWSVRVASFHLSGSRLTLLGLHVRKDGVPLLDARRIRIDYSARDLFPGSRHRYGITAVDVDGATFTLERFPNGDYSIPLHGAPPGPPRPQWTNRVPIAFTLHVTDSAIALRAPGALDPQSRKVDVRGITVDGLVDTSGRTHYRLTGAFVQPDRQPFVATGTIDQQRGYAMNRFVAGAIPMRQITDFFVNTRAFNVQAGHATGVDFVLYSLGEPASYHMSGRVTVNDARIHVVGLVPPVERLNGVVQLVDDQVFFDRVTGRVADLPLDASGAVYDFADPKFSIGIAAEGNLAALRRLFAFMKPQDIAGPAKLAIQVAGAVSSPAILATVDATGAEYRGMPFDRLRGNIGYDDSVVTFLPLEAQSQGADMTMRGALDIAGATVRTHAAVHIDAPAGALPYAGEILGNEPLAIDAILDGKDTNFYGYGSMASRRGIDRVAAVMHAGPTGTLDVAPFEVHTAHGTLAGGYHLDRHTNSSAFWLDARGLTLHAPAHPSFLGISLPAMPPIDGTVDRFTIAGGGPSGDGAMIAGSTNAHGMRIAGVDFKTLSARFAGTLASAAIDPIVASGSWGTLRGSGSLSLGAIAVRGRYAGTLQGLQPFFGGVAASGNVDGTAALAMSGGRITIQADGMRMRNAQIRGIAISSATGTMGLSGGRIRVYSARAGVGGGQVVAAGTYARGISLIATHIDGAHLRSLGLPLDAGRLDADGEIRAGAPLPEFDGGVALADGRVQGYGVSGSGLVAMRGDGAQLSHVVGGIDGMYALAYGSLAALTSGAPQYAVNADVPAADLAKAIALAGEPSFHSGGTFDAQLKVTGAGLNPRVRGNLGVPSGSINGLPFIDARARIAADRSGVFARDGSITVGSTIVQFAAAENPRVSGLHLVSEHTDLSDFDNFFDTGDTLNGYGSMRFDVISQGHRLSTNGRIDIAGFKYHDLPIGDTGASWSSAHNLLAGSLDIGGAQGMLRSHGSIAIAAQPQLMDTLRDSTYHLTGALSNVDLSTWIAAAGYPQVAVTGRVNADATLNGRFPHLAFHGTAGLNGGTVWRLPIDSAQAALSSDGNRVTIDSATLNAPGLFARASGSFGFSSRDRLALSLYASSSDLPRLVYQLWRKQIPVNGTFESSLTVGGTLAKPTFDAAFDASNATMYGVNVPLLFGSVQLRGRDLILQNAGLQLAKGSMTVEGSLPIVLQPFGIGPAGSPVSFDVAVNQVDPGAFDALLGSATKLGGIIDGTVGIAGTVRAPTVSGRFNITKGSYVSDLDRTPVTEINAALTFNRTQGALQSFSARLGNGTLTASGNATFPTEAFAIKANARGAQVDAPQFGSGSIDAKLALTHAAGAPSTLVAGSATLQNATIPFAAFIAATQSTGGPALPPLPLAFDLTVGAGRNVRVRGSGYGAGLDIGATGSVHLAGALTAPKLAGRFSATSGTLTYFDRAFRVQQAHVDFDPADGVIPTLYATGTTRVTNPDPNTALNPYGSTDITVSVTGPITGLKVEFSSSPPGYSNEQILAMIAPFGGLINGLSYAPSLNQGLGPGVPGTGVPNANPVPGAQLVGAPTTGLTAGQEAFNILNAQFSAGLLSPFEGALSQGLGLQNVNLTLDYYGNVGVSASRLLGKAVSIIYNQTFGIPQRTSFGFQLVGQRSTNAQMTFFFTTGPQVLYQIPQASASTTNRATTGEPLTGQSGFAFTLQRLFW